MAADTNGKTASPTRATACPTPGHWTTAWYVIPGDSYLARWLNILHMPYTVWNLSYVVLGAGLAGNVRLDVLGWTVLAFFLGMGVASHAFDLLQGDPLGLRLPRRHLVVVGVVSLTLAAGIGVLNVLWGNIPVWMCGVVCFGVWIAVAYNLEIWGFHGNWQFAAFWGVFPFVVGFLAMSPDEEVWVVGIVGVLFCFLTAWAQRILSTRARYLRREVEEVTVGLWLREPSSARTVREPKAWLLAPLDAVLRLMSFGMAVLAAMVLLADTVLQGGR